MRKKLLMIALAISANGILFAQQWGDYTLYSVQNSSTTYLLDTNGTTYKTWTHSSADKTGYSSYLEPGGTLVRTVARSGNSFTGGPICGKVQKVDWNGNITWDFVYSTTDYCTHHDIHPMPNGNVLLIAYERKTAAQATQAGCTQSIEIWSEKIVEVQPTGATTGTVVWEWHLWDHLVQNNNASKDNYATSITDHPELMNINYGTQKDWIHMNGVDYNPILDQITFSSHNMNEIYVIDHSTTSAEAATHSGGNSGKGGDLLYRWGNPAAYGITGITKTLNVVHDAHWIPEGSPNAGRLACFNNGGTTTKSTIDFVDAPVNGYNYDHSANQAYIPTTYTDRIICSAKGSNMGNSQQLPNGNHMICVATAGLMYEIDAAVSTLWTKTASGSVPQVFRYNKCYTDNAAPAQPTIAENTGMLTASAATTYQWYLNGQLISGATSQTYNATVNGIYVVRITDANGCVYRYSAGYVFSGGTSTAGINESDLNQLTIYPNPSTGVFQLQGAFTTDAFSIEVFDNLGKSVFSAENETSLDLTDLKNGNYLLLVKTDSGSVTKRITLIK
ncbi:aryl-sulfate sulfotransferase [Fluviicola sp.]|uniref:aryl-sulfate sulfotransferase n=1 Tax=Fluviicola sp. TaxID=1917219 RepID=UPI003D2E4166